ncbi:hypothetical protein AB0H88_38060 [Nonomuraea sp. NPDC050680]|uniref:hypothetical protein n=1 Tax=Nonomuraea sp. NPDC050680 TaxID=3154630 RepID=UPI00340DD90C
MSEVILTAIAVVVMLAIIAALVCGSAVLAAQSAPSGRHTRVARPYLVWGSALSLIGIVMMALAAWSTHEDQHYDDALALIVLAAIMGGALLILGLGPLTSWLLNFLGRHTVRLPPPFRVAAREVADDGARTAPALAVTVIATAIAIALMIIAGATTAQARAAYYPRARPGALLVDVYLAGDWTATACAAIQRELPGVPIVQNNRQREDRHFSLEIENGNLPDPESVARAGFIGDRALLRYLTGDPATPYDEGTAVVVTADGVEADTVTIYYDRSEDDDELLSKVIPAIAARSADPRVYGTFLPAKVVQDLGFRLEPDELIVDPSLHQTSALEQERLDHRLGETGAAYVERGFQPSTGWRPFVAVAVFVALGGAWAATGRAATRSRSRRVRLRVSGGSAAALRLFAACRAGFGAVCGTVMGAAAGCAIGLLLVWPMTASADWEPMRRVAFDTPWSAIIALVLGLPVLAAVIAGLSPLTKQTKQIKQTGH